VDFVYVDLTNLARFGPYSDVLYLRPLEVLLEEWHTMREAGHRTPQVAAWVLASDVGNDDPVFIHVLDVYNKPEWADLILRHNNQPVLFVVDKPELEPHPPHLATIREHGVLPVRLWGNLSQAKLDSGTAGWMQPCREGDINTTWIRPDRPCNQGYASDTPIGSVVSVSLSYQLGHASLPFQAAGRYDGLAFKKQFETALSVQPDYLLINAWNEHIASPQPNPSVETLGSLARSMGETDVDPANPGADWLWVDMYGYGQSRDIEPTLEDGSADYDLMKSCLRVYRSGHASCDLLDEACCQVGTGMTLVRSLRVNDPNAVMNTQHVLTTSNRERDSLITRQWNEVCNPIYAPPGICKGGTTGDGPFFVFAEAGSERRLLRRCYSGESNFFSLDATCEGRTVVGTLGWISTERNSETPRSLRRCYNKLSRTHFHWLDGHCPASADFLEGDVLGYVR
jgi:hypothetical protein